MEQEAVELLSSRDVGLINRFFQGFKNGSVKGLGFAVSGWGSYSGFGIETLWFCFFVFSPGGGWGLGLSGKIRQILGPATPYSKLHKVGNPIMAK